MKTLHAMTRFIAKPSRVCSLLHLAMLATEILRGPKSGHVQ